MILNAGKFLNNPFLCLITKDILITVLWKIASKTVGRNDNPGGFSLLLSYTQIWWNSSSQDKKSVTLSNSVSILLLHQSID